MFDFNNLKSKVIDSISKAADTTKDLADKATDKAKDVSRIAKLTLEISSEKDVVRKAYSEIGKLYYETHKDNPEGLFIQLCDEVTLAMENIAVKDAEIAELKNGSNDDDSIVVEFEEIVSEDEDSSFNSGEPQETAEDAVEDIEHMSASDNEKDNSDPDDQ